jgi:hypothetical protein
MKEYLEWISDTFVIDIADEYGLFKKSYPTSYYDLAQMMVRDYDSGYGEWIYGNPKDAISLKMFLPFQSNDPSLQIYDEMVCVNMRRSDNSILDKSYPNISKRILRFISKVYSYIGSNKLKLDWRSSVKQNEFYFQMRRVIINTVESEWIEIEIRFKIDISYNWEEERRKERESVDNRLKQAFGEDSDLYKKWKGLTLESNMKYIRRFK